MVAALLGVGVVSAFFLIGGRSQTGSARSGAAPGFTLTSTTGRSVSLADFRGRDVLLYFNEGVGCDACFYQTAELEKNADKLANAGLTVLPIVMNPAAQVVPEMQRFGVRTPYLIDADGAVSRAYGVLGKGMHASLPGHGFVLVDKTGKLRWQLEAPSMFVPADKLLADVQPYLG